MTTNARPMPCTRPVSRPAAPDGQHPALPATARGAVRDAAQGAVRRALLAAALSLAVAGCGATLQPMGDAVADPRVTAETYLAADGMPLPMRSWLPGDGQPVRRVVLALHGFNDYSNAFDMPGRWFARHGVATYAYDQRGFGAAGQPGIWATADTLVADLHGAVEALRRRHPETPIHLLGESMGGAVILAALGGPPPDGYRPLHGVVDGAVLSAPAVWGRDGMPALHRAALWIGRHTFPWLKLRPPRNLGIVPSDNIEMLRALGRDPLVIKETRTDAVAGLVDLMSRAQAAVPGLPPMPLMVMYGRNEQVIPKAPVEDMLATLPHGKVAVYEDGYHMLLRDLSAEQVWRDVISWLDDPAVALPSGADRVPWKAETRTAAKEGDAAS
jgi:acylglycerol lipase